jgi:aspartate/methionine/tyrosine aminotransferase
MLPPLEYLAWAIENYGQVKLDLASSGLTTIAAESIGDPAQLLADAGDARAPFRWIQAIARRFDVDVAHAVPALGTTHGLWASYAAVLSPGDDVVVETPVYEPLVRLAQGLGARVVPFSRDLARGAAIDPAVVERAMTAKTKLVVVSNLHNPTGAYVDDATLAEVAKVAAKRSAWLLVDEVYRDLVDFDADRGRTAFRLGPNVLATASLTKVYGLGFLRAGWVLAPKEVARAIFDATLHSAGGTSWALASMSARALSDIATTPAGSGAARPHDDELAARVEAFVRARPHLSFRRHRGSIFGFVEDSRGLDLRATIERGVRDEQVIVAPGVFFGAPAGFRIRYGAMPLATLDVGLARLGRALDS